MEATETKEQVLVAKETLRESQTCRLCAKGCVTEDPVAPTGKRNKSEDIEFLPLYEDLSSKDSLCVLINRYLPIQITDSDPSYPRVICGDCLKCFRQTVNFFDKIIEGQKLLAKIVNSKLSKRDERQNVKKEKVELTFSEENPVLKAPKKRGRPRKVPKTLEETIKTETEVGINEVTQEPRSKRVSRPPARFADPIIQTSVPTISEKDIGTETDVTGEKTLESTALAINTSQNHVKEAGDTTHASTPACLTDEVTNSNESLKEPDNKEESSVSLKESDLGDEEDGRISPDENQHDKDFRVRVRRKTSSRSHSTKKLSNKRRQTNIKRSIKKYYCDKCSKSFNHSSSLLYHRNTAHEPQKKFTCETCGRVFAHKQLLNSHRYVHLEGKPFTCDLCNSKFKNRSSMYIHKRSVHSKVREFTCEVCGYQFKLKSTLKSHMRLHTGEKPYKCEFCPKAFTQRSCLVEHRRSHTGEKPYICNVCTKSFTTASQLRSHKFSHLESKAHLCQICGKGFTHAGNFKYHMRRHSNEKPLECQICKKKFSEPWAFRKHMRLHSGIKPYECIQCKKTFADPSNFAKHKKLHPPSKVDESQEEGNTSADQGRTAEASSHLTTESARSETPAQSQSSVVHIVASASSESGFEAPVNISDQEQQVQQVIYVYGDNGPLFTFAMTGGASTQELKPISELADMSCMETLDERIAESASQDFESHYYTLETIDGNTVAVPITIQRASNIPESTISNSTEAELISSSSK